MSEKKLMKKENLAPVIALSVICVIVALLLGVTNLITAPIIEGIEAKKIADSLTEAFPGGSFSDPDKLPESAPDTVTAIYSDANGAGKVVTLTTTKGFTGQEIGLSVGVRNDGTVVGVVITGYNDSLGKNAMTSAVGNFKDKAPEEIEDVELVAGVTYSSKAVRGAVYDALVALGYLEPVEESVSGGEGSANNGTPVYSIIGICLVCAAIGAVVAYKVVMLIKRRENA